MRLNRITLSVARSSGLFTIAVAIGLMMVLGACSDDAVPASGDSAAVDSAAPDSVAGEAVVADQALGDQPRPDTSQADVATTLDGPKRDVTASHDGPVTTLDGAVRPDVTVAPDGPARCGSDKDCKAFQDCCDCKAVFAWETPPICKMMCLIPRCTSLGLKKPGAYCLAGRCVLADEGQSCKGDKDCTKISTCCDCLALPVGVKAPPCKGPPCLVTACVAQGLDKNVARCVNNVCKLAP